MAEIDKPYNPSIIFASSGVKTQFNDTKLQQGYVKEVPKYSDFNFILGRDGQLLAHINQHGLPIWDAETEYQANLSLVLGSNGIVYKAKSTNTNQNPVTDTSHTYWDIFLNSQPSIDITLESGWTDTTNPLKAKVSDGVLVCTGNISYSSGGIITTLPVGYRPSEDMTFYVPCIKSGSADFAIINITTGGVITEISGGTNPSIVMFTFSVVL